MIGAWQKIKPLWSFQHVIQLPALMEGDTFVLLTLNNQRGDGDSFSRSIGNLSEAVVVKIIPQTDPIRSPHDVRNRARGMPSCQLFSSKCYVKLFRKVHHRAFEGHTSEVASLGCREDSNESSKA